MFQTNCKQDICMETTHGRKSKSKVTFKAVLNKVLVSSLILATVAGMGTPAYAAEMSLKDQANQAAGISTSYGVTVENSIRTIKNTIAAINSMKANGTISDNAIKELANQLYTLETAVKSSSNGVTSDVKAVIKSAEDAISGLGNANDATIAIAVVKASLGIADNVTVTNKGSSNITSFRDVTKTNDAKWAYDAIMAMTKQGLFSGKDDYGDGTARFAPNDTMTRAEFITVVVRYLYKDELAAMPKSEGAWYSNAYITAIKHNLLTTGDLDGGDLSKQMTRQEMSMVLVRAATIKGEGPEQILDTSRIPDFNQIGSTYQDYVVKSYSMGLLCGTDTKGTFSPTGKLSRAQAATVLYRLVEPSTRQVPDFNAPVVETGTVNQSDPNRRTALAGDTFVKADGTKVILVLDKKSGVLGANQGVATDLGRKVANGTVSHGFQISSNQCDNPYYTYANGDKASYTGEVYTINPFTGEGHFDGDWMKIRHAYMPSHKGTFDGQLDSTKNLYWDELAGDWNLVVNALEYVKSVNPTGKQ